MTKKSVQFFYGFLTQDSLSKAQDLMGVSATVCGFPFLLLRMQPCMMQNLEAYSREQTLTLQAFR